MRSPATLMSCLFVFSVAAALTGCTSLDAKTGADGAARGPLELKVGHGSERPVALREPAPHVNADGREAIKETETQRKGESLLRTKQYQAAGIPNPDQDGIQTVRSTA